jgi:hypothetical protein
MGPANERERRRANETERNRDDERGGVDRVGGFMGLRGNQLSVVWWL